MASISSLGIGSGLDLSNLVNSLVAAERTPKENSLNRQEADFATQLSGMGLMRSALAEFQGSLSALASVESFSTRKVTNSNSSAITSAVSNQASIGNYDIDVTNLAEQHSLASASYSDLNSVIGTGNLSIRFGTITGPGFTSFAVNVEKATQNITIDSTNNTLSGLRDYINNNEFGVNASIIFDGTGYRLTLSSDSTGASSAMEITVTDTGDSNHTDTNGLSALAFNSAATNLTETQAGEDAALTINGLAVTSTTNTLTKTIEGLTLTLNEETNGTAVEIAVQQDSSSIKGSIEGMVDSFNSMITTLGELGSANSDASEVGILVGDSTLRNFTNSLRSLLTSPVNGVSGASVQALIDIGISTQADGSLSIDNGALDSALQDNPEDVMALFAPIGQTTDSLISFNNSTDNSIAGQYDVNITQIATQGVFSGANTSGFPLTIDANNDEFAVSIDGTSSGALTLNQGSYASGDALATEIQSVINSSTLLNSVSKSVSVTFNSGTNSFNITSNSFGAQSTVVFDSVDTTTLASLGFSVAAGTAGVDVAGTIGGQAATGNGQTLTSISGNTVGLSVDVLGGATGSRGSLSFSRGVIEELETLLDGYLESGGVISAREDGLNESLSDIQDERDALDLRMEAVEARLVAQFSALDALVAQFQSTSNFLTQQLSNLPGFTNSNDS